MTGNGCRRDELWIERYIVISPGVVVPEEGGQNDKQLTSAASSIGEVSKQLFG